MTDTILVDGRSLTLEDVERVAVGGAKVGSSSWRRKGRKRPARSSC